MMAGVCQWPGSWCRRGSERRRGRKREEQKTGVRMKGSEAG